MKYSIFLACHLASLALAAAHAAHAGETGKISLETGMDFITGRYGSRQATDILYLPFTGRYDDKSWTMKLTVPWLQITGPENLVQALNGVAPAAPATGTTRITRSGLGDVILTATHHTFSDPSSGLYARLTGKAKFGTASRVKGLGTGENDFAFQSELFRISGQQTLFGTLGYRAYGSPAGSAYRLNNGFFGSAGGTYRFSRDTEAGAFLNLGQKIVTTGSHRIEAIFFANHKIEKNWKARGYVLRGLTESVPTWGTGATIAYVF